MQGHARWHPEDTEGVKVCIPPVYISELPKDCQFSETLTLFNIQQYLWDACACNSWMYYFAPMEVLEAEHF